MVAVHFFSIHKTFRPTDADNIANLAQHPKRLGTAGLMNELLD